MVTIFHGLNFRGDEFSWIRAAHCSYYCYYFMCTNFCGFNFSGEPCPRKLIPKENFCIYSRIAEQSFKAKVLRADLGCVRITLLTVFTIHRSNVLESSFRFSAIATFVFKLPYGRKQPSQISKSAHIAKSDGNTQSKYFNNKHIIQLNISSTL